MSSLPSARRLPACAILLAVSIAANAFLLLWSWSADRVCLVSRAEFDAAVAQARSEPVSSAQWNIVHVDSPKLGILERGSLLSFRALLGGPPHRTVLLFQHR